MLLLMASNEGSDKCIGTDMLVIYIVSWQVGIGNGCVNEAAPGR